MNVKLLLEQIDSAKNDNKLLDSAAQNLKDWVGGGFLEDWALNSIGELLSEKKFDELNDRFFKNLAFGTGGMRGKTIAKNPTKFELGKVSAQGTPEHAAVGSNNMNDIIVARATLGLYKYCAEFCKNTKSGTPLLVIAHDVRHFSKHFCDLCASVWTKMGGTAYVFCGARSTPQLSYTVRKMNATAGIVITASHNPPSDNGYKVYFNDGAQATSPHAEGIVDNVNKTPLAEAAKFVAIDTAGVLTVPESVENDYVSSIEDCVVDKEILRERKPKIVYSAIHGTGAVMCPKVMRHFGLDPVFVEEQMVMDPRFPTVKQPNPEYPETMSMGMALAEKCGAQCLVATDPDADRMGAAIRTKSGKMRLITGNTIGALLIAYRIGKMKKLGIIESPKNCAIIKSFVTTPLQDAIAEGEGVKCINVLTGFKWIGARMLAYEKKLLAAMPDFDYRNSKYLERAKLLQKYSTFFVMGDEESYGFLGVDSLRDKDANSAVIMFSEMLADLESKGQSVEEYLDEIYKKYGYFLEDLKSIYYEGASGSQKIANILKSLVEQPLKELAGQKVAKFTNFATDTILDADNIAVPKETFFFYELENGYKIAVRASGTEPKIKFYVFAKEAASSDEALLKAKADARENLDKLLDSLGKEADIRSKLS